MSFLFIEKLPIQPPMRTQTLLDYKRCKALQDQNLNFEDPRMLRQVAGSATAVSSSMFRKPGTSLACMMPKEETAFLRDDARP